MKQVSLISLVVLLFGIFSVTGLAGQKTSKGVVVQAGEQYDPASIYAGDHKSDILMVKTNGSESWRRIPRFDRLKYVTCSDALAALQKEGMWQGHLNMKNGSCLTADEPASWALGNRINFDEQLSQLTSN
jgi:hypothetical protein